MTEAAFRLTDSTLRDGSHAIAHQLTPEIVRRTVSALDSAGVPVIEVSHGDGLGGSSFNFGFSKTEEHELLVAAAEARQRAKLAVLLIPGVGVRDDLHAVRDFGIEIARIATHCTEADIAEQHIKEAKKLGMEVVGFLMMSHTIEPHELLQQARLMEAYGADCVYCVDSAGAMTMDDARQRVGVLVEGLRCQVGIHAHHNLSLAVANSMVALNEGALQVDGCAAGLGAGAGNCPTEVLVAVSERSGFPSGVDTLAMVDVAQDVVRSYGPPQVVDRDGLMLGYAGVYASFLLHARRAADRFGVSSKAIILELGKRGVVGGQEDMIIDVALELRDSAETDSGSR